MGHLLPLTELVTPADEDRVVEVVRRAATTKTALYPLGGGTCLARGAWPTRPGIGLSLAGLNRVLDYPADDMTITVEAGITLAQLRQQLEAHGQWLPVDVPQAEQATVGGALAVNLFGPRRYGYGTLRDYLLGLAAVDGQGTPFAAGSRVVKNAAGLNLARLLVGTLGTFGVITRVTLMVRPQPELALFVAAGLKSWQQAETLLAALGQSEAAPVAIELLAGPSWRTQPLPGVHFAAAPIWLVVALEGAVADVNYSVGRVCDAWAARGITAPHIARGPEVVQWWQQLVQFQADVQFHVLPSRVAELAEELRRLDPHGSLQAHAGNGVIKLRLSSALAEHLPAVVRNELRPAAQRAGGHMLVLRHRPDDRLTAADVWGPPPPSAPLAQTIKERFDPAGILNPGRFCTTDE